MVDEEHLEWQQDHPKTPRSHVPPHSPKVEDADVVRKESEPLVEEEENEEDDTTEADQEN